MDLAAVSYSDLGLQQGALANDLADAVGIQTQRRRPHHARDRLRSRLQQRRHGDAGDCPARQVGLTETLSNFKDEEGTFTVEWERQKGLGQVNGVNVTWKVYHMTAEFKLEKESIEATVTLTITGDGLQ